MEKDKQMRFLRTVGWMWEVNHLRPLYWKEYLYWKENVLPFGWSITRIPDEDVTAVDYAELIVVTKFDKLFRNI